MSHETTLHIEIAYIVIDARVKVKYIWRGYDDVKGRFDDDEITELETILAHGLRKKEKKPK